VVAVVLATGCSAPASPQDLAYLLPAAPEVSYALNGAGSLDPATVVADTVVFPVDPARGEYPRIPVLLRALDGSLVAVATIRLGSISDSAPSLLRAAVSRDGGRTWVHHDIAPNTSTEDGDSAAVVDPATGRILVFGNGLHTSDDGGVTWTTRPLRIGPNAAGVVGDPGGPGAGIAVRSGPHAGRLVVMCRATTGPPPLPLPGPFRDRSGESNCTLTSDDGGSTWTTSTTVQGWVGEGSVVELADGRLYMSSRTYLYDGRRAEAYSPDGGTTWTDLGRSVLPEPVFGVNGSLTRLTDPGTGADVVLYTNVPEWDAPFGIVPLVRKDLSVYVSTDGTRSWRFGRVLRRGPGAYSSMAAIDGDVGVLFEAVVEGVNSERSVLDPAEGIRFLRFPVAAVTG